MSARKVLILDDSIVVRQRVGQVLRTAGFEVIEASNGEEGLGYIEAEDRLSLILCDVNMPILDGLEMLERVRARGLAPTCPVVMLTSEAQPAQLARARAMGVKAWMVKPVKPDALLAAVKKLAL